MSFKRMFYAVETHSGEPMRVVTGGVPYIPGDTVYEQMRWLEKNDDQIRQLMLKEPRGYPPLCCNILVPPKDPKASAGYIIMEQAEYPVMSGGNTISVATVLLETGIIPMIEPVTEFILEAPAGLIGIRATCNNGKVTAVEFENVPAFAVYIDKEIDVPHIGKIKVDVAWGGMFFVIADVRQFKGLEVSPEHGGEIGRIGAMVRKAAQEQLPVAHPHYPGIGITATELYGPSTSPDADLKNAVVNISGEFNWDDPDTWTGPIDRCPCGTGTCAKMAVLYAKGELELNQPFRHAGILDTVYTGRVIKETKIGEYDAVVPTLSGQSWITGYSTHVLDHSDPLNNGYAIGDIWGC